MPASPLRILVSGAASGFGLGTVRLLAGRGHHVFAGVRDLATATHLREEFSSPASNVRILQLDLRNSDDIARAGEMSFDVLVNNAGFGSQGPISESPLDLVRSNFEVNVFGTLNLTQRFLAERHRGGRSGRVIFVSSVAGLFVSEGAGAYTVSKHALDALAVELQNEMADSKITIHIVNPGPYLTGFNEKLVDSAPTARRISPPDHSSLLEGQHSPKEMIEVITNLADGTIDDKRVVLPAEFIEIVSQYQKTQLGGY